MTTLAQLMVSVARVVTHHREGTATAPGSSTTLVDTAMDETQNFFAGGTLFVLAGPRAGLTTLITSSDKGTHTYTFPAMAPPTLGPGTPYMAIGSEYTRNDLVAAINAALDDLGAIPLEDDSLKTVAGQLEYDLPAGVNDVRQVWVGGASGAESFHWVETPTRKLRFDQGWAPGTADQTLLLVYQAPAPYLVADTDPLPDCLAIERLKWSSAVNAYRSRFKDVGNQAPTIPDGFKEAIEREQVAIHRNPVPQIPRSPHYAGW